MPVFLLIWMNDKLHHSSSRYSLWYLMDDGLANYIIRQLLYTCRMSPFIKLAVMIEVNKPANPNAHMLHIQKPEGR